MRKTDILYFILFAIPEIILLFETWAGLDVAVYCLAGWTILSLIGTICILKDYVITYSYHK